MRNLLAYLICAMLLVVLPSCTRRQELLGKDHSSTLKKAAPPQQKGKLPSKPVSPKTTHEVSITSNSKLVLGTYKLASGGVVDGDTIRVKGERRALRLLALDTEELTYSVKGHQLELMRTDFKAYVKRMTSGYRMPAKFGTPMGEAAKTWARNFFSGAKELRLEGDTPGEAVGTYGRLLCYVWAFFADGKPPKQYNLEAIRAGMSPYFIKYGRSRRFDAAFRAAQAEARKAKRGIWSPNGEHYPDYPARLIWWENRAEALDRYHKLITGPRPPINMGEKDTIRKLSGLIGKEVAIFGVIADHNPQAVRMHDKGATLRVGGRKAIEVEIVGKELAERLKPKQWHGLYLLVTGPLDREGSVLRGTLRYMRIVITAADQIQPGHLAKTP